MPNTRSAKKAVRVSLRKQARNKPIRSAVKTHITKAEKQISSDELEPAREAVTTAISALDKAAAKGVIHPSNAARRKSRLMKKLNQAQAQPSAAGEEEGSQETP